MKKEKSEEDLKVDLIPWAKHKARRGFFYFKKVPAPGSRMLLSCI